MMRPTFVIFSGLPGTGKSALADRLARELHWPLLCIDDLASCIPVAMDRNTYTFWDQAISALLLMAEAQLKLGISVIADSIFMNLDRFHARAIAYLTGARLLPVHTFVSDEAVWEKRVSTRFQVSDPADGVASWSQVTAQRGGYRPWDAGTALFVDAIRPLDENYAAVQTCVSNPETEFQPLAEVPFTPGKYHG
jgi:predicted kinase